MMLFSKKDLVKLILPLVFQQLLAILVSMVDSMMVSYAGEAAVSGVSLVGTLDNLLIQAFAALTTGGSVIVSQYIGKKEPHRARDAAMQLIFSTTFVATVLSAVVMMVRIPLLNLFYGSTEAAVMSNAQDYLFFILFSFPFLALNNACNSLFRTMGNSLTPMLCSLLTNAVNICGNAILIYGFKMGAAGAAIATLLARIVTSTVLLSLLRNPKRMIHLRGLRRCKPNFGIIKQILHIGIPGGIENSMFQFGRLLTQSVISSMSTAAIAANAVANTISTLQHIPGISIGNATVPIVGRCIGAGEKEQAKKYSCILLIAAYLGNLAVILITTLLLRPIIGLYTLSDEAVGLAVQILLFHAVAASILWPPAFSLPHTFRAASDAKFPSVISSLSMWIFRVGFSYLLALDHVSLFGITIPCLGLGIMGVWYAMTADWLFRAVIYGIRYVSNHWLTKYKDLN